MLHPTRPFLMYTIAVVSGLYSSSGVAQSITTEPMSSQLAAAPVPVNSPWALLLLVLAVFATSFWLLRHQRHRQIFSAVLATAAAGLALWQSPDLRAQVLSSFTDPQGETLEFSVNPIIQQENIARFNAQHFVNDAGVGLRITEIDMPSIEACFPDAQRSLLPPSQQPDPDEPPACFIGLTLDNSAACSLDIDSHCRKLWSDSCFDGSGSWVDMRLVAPLNTSDNVAFYNSADGTCLHYDFLPRQFAVITIEGEDLAQEMVTEACVSTLGTGWEAFSNNFHMVEAYSVPDNWYLCTE